MTTTDPAVRHDDAARVRWARETGVGQLDGGWWPHTRDVARELAQLLAASPEERGRITRVSLCAGDWPLPHPTRAEQRGRPVKVGWFATMEPHTVALRDSSRGAPTLLLVVPDGATGPEAEAELAAASAPTERRATALLAPA